MNPRPPTVFLMAVSFFCLGVIPPVTVTASQTITIPLTCDHGPSGQKQGVVVSVPASVTEGSTYLVRVDGTSSGKISHVGLNYIFDMWFEWLVPSGAQYVEGSARIVPNTGSENVRAGARIVHQAGVIGLVLPAHVRDGASYTPPSFEFQLTAPSSPGTLLSQAFGRYHVTASAFLVGTVHTTCDPNPRPFVVATTKVEPARDSQLLRAPPDR